MDAPRNTHEWLDTLIGAIGVGALWIIRHVFGRRVGQVFDKQRRDWRETRVIPRPEAAEVVAAREDAQAVRAGLSQLEQHLKSEVQRIEAKVDGIEAKVDDQVQRFAAHAESEEEDRVRQQERLVDLERTIIARVDASHSATQQDVKQLVSQVGELTGQMRTLIDMQSRRRAGD